MNRFASIRFDRALDETDRSPVTHALASLGANATSWAIAGERTYASISGKTLADFPSECGDARYDDPSLVVVRVRPLAAQRLGALARAILGPGRPQAVIDGTLTAEEVVVEIEPTGRALHFVLGYIDETLVATPGRTITPVLALNDAVLAEYASLRLRESQLDASRVLDPYVEAFARAAGAPA